MLNLVETAARIVLEHGTVGKPLDTIINDIRRVYASLKVIEEPAPAHTGGSPPSHDEEDQYITVEEAFGKKEIKCLVCGQGGMKVLKQHLTRAHQLTPKEYRLQFGLPRTLPLVSNEYHEQRRSSAIARGLGKGTRTALAPQQQTSAIGFQINQKQTPTETPRGFQIKTRGSSEGFVIRKKQLNAAK